MLIWKGSALKVHYLIKFTKESEIKFIGHLDLLRTIQRMIKRSTLPVEYSSGFNPHMQTLLAQPLGVGIYSGGDYMDVFFKEEIEESKIINSLNACAPGGIKILEAVKIVERKDAKLFKSMAAIDAADYKIEIKYTQISSLDEEIKEILTRDKWIINRKTKTKEEEIDIRPMVHSFKYSINNNVLVLKVLLSCGSRENLSADLFKSYIVQNTTNYDMNSFVDIKREEMYAILDKKFIPLYQFGLLY
jgi:radical SAM-linked protein